MGIFETREIKIDLIDFLIISIHSNIKIPAALRAANFQLLAGHHPISNKIRRASRAGLKVQGNQIQVSQNATCWGESLWAQLIASPDV